MMGFWEVMGVGVAVTLGVMLGNLIVAVVAAFVRAVKVKLFDKGGSK